MNCDVSESAGRSRGRRNANEAAEEVDGEGVEEHLRAMDESAAAEIRHHWQKMAAKSIDHASGRNTARLSDALAL